MKFLRYGPPGEERPGVLDANGRIRDLSDMMSDLSGPNLGRLGRVDPDALPCAEGAPRLGVPVAGVGKIVCVAFDHAAEAGLGPPAGMSLRLKAASSLAGPNDPIVLPKGAQATDCGVDLGVVIGRAARMVREDDALAHVAGYVVLNDVADRAFPLGGSCDTFGPAGPWLVTPDEVGDPQRLTMELTVNGETVQKGTTATMVCPVAWIVSHLSAAMTLHPGDIVAAGLVSEVGRPARAPRVVGPGDVVEARIEGLGRQRQVVEAGWGASSSGIEAMARP